ncbi:hypothetical protein F5Y03DRAFT_389802 [Xylaria venustula]|nr:hypothetical protein F5Y03DRAFT_389802 [Xylaria venustula]
MASSSQHNPYPPTILRSFEESLPLYQDDNSSLSTDIQLSGESTRRTDAPKFWTNVGDSYWEKGASTLGNKRYHNHLKHLDFEFIYRKEQAIELLVEGDVTRAAALYLLHPVNQVLSALKPNTRCLSEHAANRIRTDVSYRISGSTFAVIEFKKRGTIRLNEFAAACRLIDNNQPNRQTQINQYIEEASSNRDRTFFKGNSLKMMKQAANYAVKEGTCHVALFDWDCLVLITFGINIRADQETRTANGAGEWCHIAIVENPAKMRKALLGFLVEASTGR